MRKFKISFLVKFSIDVFLALLLISISGYLFTGFHKAHIYEIYF